MTTTIWLTLGILALAVVLFITERLRADLVAILVLVALAFTRLVTPEQALSGFSSPAVVTVWAVFILSAGLSRTGVAGWLGRQVVRLGGSGEMRLLAVIMLAAAVLSGFMNNVGVTAMLLPVVLDIARRTDIPPSRLLLPLAFSSLFGGMTTLIGTPSNILVSNALSEYGYSPFELFDFTPFGVVLTAAGLLYLLFFGRKLLPRHDPARDFGRQSKAQELDEAFAIQERLFVVCLPEDSPLAGKTLADSRLGAALGINVVGIMRNKHTNLAPGPDAVLQGGDRLLTAGRPDRLLEMLDNQDLVVDDRHLTVDNLISNEVQIAEVGLSSRSALIGQTLEAVGFRQRFGCIVLALWRDGRPIRTNLETIVLQVGDFLLIQASMDQLQVLLASPDFMVSGIEAFEMYRLHERLLLLSIPEGSRFGGKTLVESHLGAAYGLGVMGIIRDGKTHLMPRAQEQILPGDTLIVKGQEKDLAALRGLQHLEIDHRAVPRSIDIESDQIGMVEVILSPQTTLAGKSLRQLDFRGKYGLSVLALLRAGKPMRFNLRDETLRFGDALLVFGRREKLRQLADARDFLVLAEEVQPPPRLKKAPLAALFMIAVVVVVGLGWLPISIAAMAGAALMVLTGCIDMNEAYQAIEWKAVVVIACMLPLGIAMQTSGTAQLLANQVITIAGPYGEIVQLGGLFLMTMLASQVMPNPVVTVLMAPIAFNTAAHLGYSPQSMMMVIAVAASASFLSPVGHSVNILVMGPGGYKFSDYFKLGLPLVIIAMLLTLFVLPIFWPL